MWKHGVALEPKQSAEALVLVAGNCQAHYLAATLAAQGLGLVCVVGRPYGFMPQARGVSPYFADHQYIDEIVGRYKAAGSAVILVEQTSPVSDGALESWLRAADVHVRFPHIEAQALWPHLSSSESAYKPDRIRRRWALDLAAMRRSEAKAGWDTALTDHIEASIGSRMLMHTFNHPAGEIAGWLHRRLCEDLGLDRGVHEAGYALMAADIRAENGISFMSDSPLRPEVIEALDLNWAREGWYGLWVEAIAASARPDMAESLRCLRAALAIEGRDPHIHYSEALVLEALGDYQGAHRAFAEAYRAYPKNRVYADRWLGAFLPTTDSPFSAQHAQRFEWP